MNDFYGQIEQDEEIVHHANVDFKDSYCMQCQKPKYRSEMTYINLPKGGKRRMCDGCKAAHIERKRAKKPVA